MAWWNFGSKGGVADEPAARVAPTFNIGENYRLDDLARVFANEERLTADAAMRHSAVLGCVRVISQMIASLPVDIYSVKRQENVADHPMKYLLDVEPNSLVSARDFWEQVVLDKLLRGNAYVVLERNGFGETTSMTRYAAHNVEVIYSKKRLIYKVTERGGATRVINQLDMLHIRYMGCSDFIGKTPIQVAGNSIIAGNIENKHSELFYKNGGQMKHIISLAGTALPEAKTQFENDFKENNTGEQGVGSMMILENGTTLTTETLSAVDAQTLEARKWRVIDICRLFGVPPFLIEEIEKQTSFGKGVADQFTFFVRKTLRPMIEKIEAEVNRKLFGRDSEFRMRFNLDDLLRGDLAARAEYLRSALGGNQLPAWMTPDEARIYEKMKPMNDGYSDKLYRPNGDEAVETDESKPNETSEQDGDSEQNRPDIN